MCDVLHLNNQGAVKWRSGEVSTSEDMVRQGAQVGVNVVPHHLFPPFRGGEVRVGRQTHFIEVAKLVPMPRFSKWGQTAAQLFLSLSQKIRGVAHG